MKDFAQETFSNQYKSTVDAIIKRVLAATPSTLLGLPGTGKSRISKVIKKQLLDRGDIVIISISTNELVERDEITFYKTFLVQLNEAVETYGPKSKTKNVIDYTRFDNLFDIFTQIKKLLKLITDAEYRVLIYISGMTKLKDLSKAFFTSLYSLHDINKSLITFYFTDTPDFKKIFTISKAEELYDQMMNSVVWLQLPDRKSFDADMRYWEKYFGHKLSEILKDFIWEQTHGHPALCKYLSLYFSESEFHGYTNAIAEFYAINTRLERILSILDTNEIDALISIINGDSEKVAQETIDRLQKYGLIESIGEDNIDLTIKLLKDFLIKETNSIEIVPRASALMTNEASIAAHKEIVLKHGNVEINGNPVTPDLTKREYKVFEYLMHNQGKIVSRESIAKVIWGNNYEEKFSDWSMDQTISRLRKKIGDNGYSPRYLKTLRGRGFKLE